MLNSPYFIVEIFFANSVSSQQADNFTDYTNKLYNINYTQGLNTVACRQGKPNELRMEPPSQEQEVTLEVASLMEPSANVQGDHESRAQVVDETAQVNSSVFSAVKSSVEDCVEQNKCTEGAKRRKSVQSGSQIEIETDFGINVQSKSNVKKNTDAEAEVLTDVPESSKHESNKPENTFYSENKKVVTEVAGIKDPDLPPPGESADNRLVNTGDLHERTSPQIPLPEVTQSLYHIKWFKWKGLTTALIMQNENGPCPLLAVINLLILSRKVSIPPVQEFITAGQLMEYLGDCILEHAPKVRIF